MGLLPQRQIKLVNTDFQAAWAAERGGCLTAGLYSGVYMVGYHNDPSGKAFIGILMHDVEQIEFDREYFPSQREVSQPLDIVGAISEGEVITDFVDPTYSHIAPGVPAYVGPSGLVTDKSSYGGTRIGYFTSTVGSTVYGLPQHDTHKVLVLGGGLQVRVLDRNQYNPGTTTLLNPTKIYTNVAGWVKLRINMIGAS